MLIRWMKQGMGGPDDLSSGTSSKPRSLNDGDVVESTTTNVRDEKRPA
jgi:hypothetical protein